ncbi:MAG: hypothetical protein M1833_000261 [Piccolia ochrophora]|nr:MAG: hypothetical protein M1833_000261 [Piccolia ochrophora]
MVNHDPFTTSVSAYVFTGLALVIALTRLLLRWRGRDTFKPDDWLMLAAWFIYAVATACVQIILRNGSNVGIKNPDDLMPEEIGRRALGAKFALLGRPFYMTYIWLLKACILLYYQRLTDRVREVRAVRICAAFVVLTWIGCMLSFFLPCQPIQKYWQVVPDPGLHCTAAPESVITMGSTNIFTDLFLMLIPLPLILRVRLPWKTKLQLMLVFCMGIFVIMVSVMRMIIVLNALTQVNKLIWGQLECFTATIVANAPTFREFWICSRHRARLRRAFDTGSGGSSIDQSKHRRPSDPYDCSAYDQTQNASREQITIPPKGYIIERTVALRQESDGGISAAPMGLATQIMRDEARRGNDSMV